MDKSYKHVIPTGHVYIKESVLEKRNVFGVSADKTAWAAGLDLPKKAEYTFFAGCGYQLMKYADGMMASVKTAEKMGVGMEKVVGISKAFGKVGIDLAGITGRITAAGAKDVYTRALVSAVNVLKKLSVDVGYMGAEEPCCGSPLYYSGFASDYIDNAQKNYALFKSMGVKKIIGVVPACTASLKNAYPRYINGYDLEVKHFLEVVADRLRKSKTKPVLKEKMTITYHDPCQMSRVLNLAKLTREVMSMIGGLELREPEADQTGEWSTCCGGGGGMEVVFPELCERLAVRRINELMATGAPVIATSCPACMMQLMKGTSKLNTRIKVVDLAEILDKALPE
jgi:heterodisulfide reductase subunit B